MAIILKFNFFIVKKVALDAHYPGGMKQFREDYLVVPSQPPGGEDDHLVGFCSMGWYFAEVIEKLYSCGLEHQKDGRVVDIAFGDYISGIEDGCDWLSAVCDEFFWKTCWLAGTDPGEAVSPIFW